MKLHCSVCNQYKKMVRYDYKVCAKCKEKVLIATNKLRRKQ